VIVTTGLQNGDFQPLLANVDIEGLFDPLQREAMGDLIPVHDSRASGVTHLVIADVEHQ
jgi:hypothetical protein